MSAYKEYINIYDEYKINLDSNEIYMAMDENILMKMRSCLTNIQLHRYPANDMKIIKELYANYAKTDAKNIIVGNGSDEVLELVISKIIKSGKKALSLGPDFTMYDFFVSRFGGQLKNYDIGKRIEFNVDEFIKLGKKENVDLIIFSNPNNPTGIGITIKDILKILNEFKNKTILVDEAYYEFYGETMIPYINKYKNLIVTRTLSKAWGLAALRIGFLITNEDNVEELLNYKVPYTISTYSQNLASIALKYPERVVNNAKQIVDQREKLYEALKQVEKNAAMNIEFYPSKANFIYGRTNHKEALINGLKDNGISIRNFNDDTFRITVGSPLENRKVVEGIKNIFVY
ncbi:pyridoxal phosphate-dependent aminotransferase [Clostridium saccharobutylicum]|uniref:Histidinol-phosphate aminotransferase HisC n=1 Tax=Clostridium saccharobutylicum DSM 13864 TaxID=1345695 RepID=U5MTI4_CLOSA|nr:aminotransferase class I/II-fold pyridoxal phosphate-dependent enzyme [Clostridium saccharobutylicum]AGX44099.1 histidinol-phosphate aminotransferase HisC [Clostridium saccharobutylicum DSM 13864]AQR91389.1 histidinol-phosphate aminotransferase [Clostridium saccharobutylicum]AQS01293.1 histidinol-phosphate aminotransferase [Clostridium saccharobutylicum]AQS15276.1 histidinol-phosphate aminotransferase [Clostridium saccharobutylicum]MBA2905849.1 histidinol-phosphate aminotransferase [Clostri